MKKTIALGVAAAIAVALPLFASAQTVVDTSACNIDLSQATQSEQLACLSELVNEVIFLQNELNALQAASTTTAVAPDSTPVASTTIETSTPAVDPVTQTSTQSMPDELGAATPPAPAAISVSFAQSGDSEGLVTVKNTLSIPVRIVDLDVDGTLVGFTIGTMYGKGFTYPPSFTDSQGEIFNVFTCTGLDSLGVANLGTGKIIDPCARRDANLAKNELQPGETMILRYTGDPTKVTYQEGSIVDLDGNDIQF